MTGASERISGTSTVAGIGDEQQADHQGLADLRNRNVRHEMDSSVPFVGKASVRAHIYLSSPFQFFNGRGMDGSVLDEYGVEIQTERMC